MKISKKRSKGFTLLELLVVLALLALLLSMGALAVTAVRPMEAGPVAARVDSARREAIRSGTAVALRLDSAVVRFLPDGRAIGPGVDPLTGAWEGR